MTWAILCNGTDLADYGFHLQSTEGIFSSSKRTLNKVWIPGRGMLYTAPAKVEDRMGVLNGALTTSAKTVTALETAMDQFKSLLTSGYVRVVKNNGSTTARLIDGYVTAVDLQPVDHPAATADVMARISIECPTPYWRVAEPTSRALMAVNTPYTLPLGTAPSTPIIRLMGISSFTPVLTYLDASGTTVKTFDPGITLAIDDWLDIDMRTAVITRWTSGVASNVTAFTGDFPWVFDPQDGDWATSQWPMLSIAGANSRAVAYWWKNYL